MFKDRFERIKLHVVKYKREYIIGAGGIAIGAAGMYIFRRPEFHQIVKNSALIAYKSPQSNTVVTSLARRGHPGNLVRCLETGEVFASQNRAAQALGLGAGNLVNHLNGKLPHVKGLHFERIGEAVA